MLLSADTYEQIVRTLRSDASTPTERRKHPRVGMRAKITVIPLTPAGQPGKADTVWVRDISDGGIGLVAGRAMKRGSLFVVQFSKHNNEARSLLCQVVQCRGADILVGGRIIRSLTGFENEQIAAHRPVVIDPDEIPRLRASS